MLFGSLGKAKGIVMLLSKTILITRAIQSRCFSSGFFLLQNKIKRVIL